MSTDFRKETPLRVAIIGTGLIGGSVAMDLRASGYASQILGVDASPAHGIEAVERGIIDRAVSLETAVAESDLVIIAIPVDAILRLLPRVLDLAGPGTTITDLGSTKERIVESVRNHPRRAQYVASHPMAGTENSGPASAFAGLFARKVAVICDREQSGEPHLKRVEEMYGAMGMRLVQMTSPDHDLHVAYVSHMPHISSVVLANTVLMLEKDVATIFDLASGGFESTARLAKSSPEMWAPIFDQNQTHVLNALESYIRELSLYRDVIARGDTVESARLIREANAIRPILANISSRKTTHPKEK